MRNRDFAPRTALNSHEYAIDQRHITVSFKYWQLHSTGRRRYSSYRWFLSRTADRYPRPYRDGGSYIAEDTRSFTRAVGSRSFLCECSRCRTDFMNVGRLPNRRANMTCMILCFRLPVGPISRFSACSTAYFVCPLIFVNLCICGAFRSSSRKCIASASRNIRLVRVEV